MSSPPETNAPKRDRNVEFAIALMVIAVLILPAIDAIAKVLSTTIPAGQVAWARFIFQVAFLAPFVLSAYRRTPATNLGIQALRGVLIATTTVLIFAAVKVMPIADVIAIFFVEPLIVTLLSAIFLGERIGWRRVLAAVVGFAGALIVVRPSYDLFGPTSILPLGAALCFAIYIVLTRRLARHQEPVVMQFNSGLSGLVFMSAALVIGHAFEIPVLEPVWPKTWEWGLLALSGAIATAGHLMIAMAFRHVEAGVLAPFQYLEIIGATAYGLWLFGDFPDSVTWIGITIIVGSGLYIFHRERVRGRGG
jgi:S-adenosylmethionine uptake transporter